MSRFRPGRPLIQFVTGVLIGVIALGLLVIVIANIRNAAGRSQCQNNVRSIVMALSMYQDVEHKFPSGTMPNPDLPPDRRLSWMLQIIPYMESTKWYTRVDRSAAWDTERNRPITMHSYRPYTCPLLFGDSITTASYPGIAGIGPDAASLPTDDRHAGVFGYDRQTQLGDITDGLATTLLILETETGGPWARGGSGTVRGLDADEQPLLRPDGPFGSGHVVARRLFGRNLIGGNAGMANTSVRFITEAIDPKVLEALSTIAGKDEVPTDW